MNHQEVFIKASKLGIPIYSKPTSFMAKVTIMDEDEVPETPEVPENPDTHVNPTLPPLHKNITVSNNVQLKDGKYGIFHIIVPPSSNSYLSFRVLPLRNLSR